MKHSLYLKFILGYLVFGLLGFTAIGTLSARLMHNHLVEEQAEAMYDEANLIASSYSSVYQGKKQDLNSAYPQLQAVAEFVKAEIWVVNRQGIVVVDSDRSARTGTVIEDFDPTATGNKSYCIGDYYGQFPYDVLSVSAPITGNYNTYGYVLVHLPMSQIGEVSNSRLNVVYISAAIIFVLSLIILLVFTKTVYFPLKKITEGANEYAAGNLEYHIDLSSRDEMGYLAATLNYMSDELNKMEEYQRTFIANVSHDFRSPLTSIKGYLEAIIDGTIPPEMYEKYLKRVITETDRLTKLTQGMLTLNSLDSRGYLSRSNFDINRVIKDTAASFEGTCDAKNITFDLTFSDNIQMVYADLGKIQQVLYNLIDNAIKFSHPDSTIYIQTYVRNEKLFVSVKDTGIGIPRDSVKKIWERFYKSDLSRGKDKKGTGLGLAIVKEIIQAHGQNIDVISTEGVGSEFIFSLPRATNL
ncbi:HAMP domain-containing sensor histidine kinase [Clostridium sp. AN503]|uniref:HAMP domain-containing sensor histidine kinase n=1 Tax=Clostridium sp. AN503 TaxID=3160598 RepID=UPI00345B26D3